MKLNSSVLLFAALVSAACSTASKAPAPQAAGKSQVINFAPDASNSEDAQKRPYVILISIDGYRHDYNKMFAPPHLTKIASEGITAESLRPVYPSKTFPNHYSIVTGLAADRHGIVSNEFYDPARDAQYAISDRKAVEDGSWYGGEPLWILAGRQGMLSASFFWVGAEADVQGLRPNYYLRYEAETPYEARVDQVLAWLKLPPAKRPHFITLYFEAVDGAAHRFGVGSREVKEAVAKVDQAVGRLQAGLAASGLDVNVIVVSDHGMQDVDARKVIILDELPPAAKVLEKFKAVGRGPQMLLYLKKGETQGAVEEAIRVLRRPKAHYRIWRRSEMARFRFSASPRAGDLIIEPDAPYLVGLKEQPPGGTGANHGWDPVKFKTMHGSFFAAGPAFKPHAKLPTIDNVDIYPLIIEILGLKQRTPADGQLDVVRGVLR